MSELQDTKREIFATVIMFGISTPKIMIRTHAQKHEQARA